MNAIAHERYLIGAIMQKPELLDRLMVEFDPADIEDHACYTLYRTAVELAEKNVPVTAREVFARVQESIEEMGGEKDVITLLRDNMGRPSLVNTYTDKIRAAAIRRRMRAAAFALIDASEQEELSDQECLTMVNEQANAVASRRQKNNVRDVADIFEDYLATTAVAAEDRKPVKSPKIGIFDIDDKLGGFGNNRLIAVAGRPGGGKTTFVVQALHHIGHNENCGPTILFTMEMDGIEIVEKMVADLYNVDYTRVQNREFDEKTLEKLRARGKIKKGRMFVDDTSFIDVNHVVQVCRQYKRIHGELGAIGIDYLGLMNKLKAKGDTTTEAIGRITMTLKQLARELGCSIFMLSQMNRENERSKQLPTMADLRDSGNIEQDSDMVLFLHRRPDNEQLDPRITRIQLVVAKGRKTGTCVIDLNFSGPLQRISSAAVRSIAP